MKKILLNIIILLITVLLTSCDHNYTTSPNDIGELTFKVIKNVKNNSLEDFHKNFVSLEILKDYAQDPESTWDEYSKNHILSLDEENYYEESRDIYKKLKLDLIENNINLEEIEYLDFIYDKDSNDGVTTYEGSVYFKDGDRIFEIESHSLEINGKIYLTDLDGIYEE